MRECHDVDSSEFGQMRVREISLTVRSLRVVSLFKGAVGTAMVWSQFLEVKERFKHHAKLMIGDKKLIC